MKNIYQILEDLGITYQKYDHPPVYTVEDAEKYDRGNGGQSKNLFLRNKKGNKHYLVILEASKRLNLKQLESLLEEVNLSFASAERLLKYLGVTPGSVSPFGLIHDTDNTVKVIVDKDLLEYENQSFHPNVNTSTLVIKTPDFQKFLRWTQNTVIHLNL